MGNGWRSGSNIGPRLGNGWNGPTNETRWRLPREIKLVRKQLGVWAPIKRALLFGWEHGPSNSYSLWPWTQYRISPNGGRSNSLEVKYFFLAFMCGKWSEKRVGTHFGAYYWVPRSLERVSFSALASAGERGNGIADSYESSTLLWYFFWAKFILGDENTIVKRHKYDKKNKIY